jgi:hypothetical protein
VSRDALNGGGPRNLYRSSYSSSSSCALCLCPFLVLAKRSFQVRSLGSALVRSRGLGGIAWRCAKKSVPGLVGSSGSSGGSSGGSSDGQGSGDDVLRFLGKSENIQRVRRKQKYTRHR